MLTGFHRISACTDLPELESPNAGMRLLRASASYEKSVTCEKSGLVDQSCIQDL